MKIGQTTANTYLEHARQSQLISQNKTVKEMMELPICPKCQRAGLRHLGWKTHQNMGCPFCGYVGPTTKVMQAFLDEGLYK